MMDRLMGFPIRLMVDLDGEEHDASSAIRLGLNGRVDIDVRAFMRELELERRTRERVKERA